MKIHGCLGIALFLTCTLTFSGVPSEYGATVIEAPFSFSEHVYDLTPAVNRARSERKPLFIYYGAQGRDCPPCVQFERFLEENKADLVPHFKPSVIADIRGWLRSPKLVFVIDGERYSFGELNRKFGDARQKLWFPYVWYVTPELRQIQQLGDGSGPSPTDELFDGKKLKTMLANGRK